MRFYAFHLAWIPLIVVIAAALGCFAYTVNLVRENWRDR